MPCFHPVISTKSFKPKSNGKHIIKFGVWDPEFGERMELPCYNCNGCRLQRSQQWAARCYHESKLHDDNAFITLTYDNEHLPYGGTLVLKHFQDFMKRLRSKHPDIKIVFYHCGEYGDNFGRPHYHACLFGFDFKDKELFQQKDSVNLYISEELTKLWGKGFCTTGDVTLESAGYVARYIMKKVNGDLADDHYETLVPETGEIIQRNPEYTTMSLKPAVGKLWFKKYLTDVFPSDEIIIKGKKLKPPKYYDGQYELINPEHLKQIKLDRQTKAALRADDNTPKRLAVKEKISNIKLKKLKRQLK